MKLRIEILCATLLLPACCFAGEIKGTVKSGEQLASEHQQAVVWVEGAPADGASQSAEEKTINQQGIKFDPSLLVVVQGETVKMPNNDDVAHNVFSLSPAKKFKLGIYPKGQSREVKFEKPGVIDLFCSIHRHMHAVVVVVPTQHYVETTVGGDYKIENLPAGKYTVHYWNQKLGSQKKEVAVGEGVTTFDVNFVK